MNVNNIVNRSACSLFVLLSLCISPIAVAMDTSKEAADNALIGTITEIAPKVEQLNTQIGTWPATEVTTKLQEIAEYRELLKANVTLLREASQSASDEPERLANLEKAIGEAVSLQRSLESQTAELERGAQARAIETAIEGRGAALDSVQQRLSEAVDGSDLVTLREELRVIRTTLGEEVASVNERKANFEADLAQLGDPPGPEEAAEPESVSTERAVLEQKLSLTDSLLRKSDQNTEVYERLLAEIVKSRRQLFYDRILTRDQSPLNPSTLSAAATNLVTMAKNGADLFSPTDQTNSEEMTQKYSGWLTVFGVIVIIISLIPLRLWLLKKISTYYFETTPKLKVAIRRVMLEFIARFTSSAIACAIFLELVFALNPFGIALQEIRVVLLQSLAIMITTEASLASLIPARDSKWNISPFTRGASARIKILVAGLAAVYSLDLLLSGLTNLLGGNSEFALIQSSGISVTLAVLLYLLVLNNNWHLKEETVAASLVPSEKTQKGARLFAVVVKLIALLSVICALIGFVALAHFSATRLFLLIGLFVLGMIFRYGGHGLLDMLNERLHESTGENQSEQEGERLIVFWLGAFIDLVTLAILVPLGAVILGADLTDVLETVESAFFGFQIGSIRISIAQILLGIAVFIGILFLTRLIQRGAETQFFPKTRMDSGVQNSLKTIIGYVGLVIAAMAAISLLGFNLANLAIIAGALSLGIGFGLQSIVNNFVSGLILLFERPVKVGDWIVVSSGEGTVKRISVRSTEIETFDRSSIIVPNSELVSSSVQNWTYKDKLTRLLIPVGVSYDADPQTVLDLLSDVIAKSNRVMRYPEPSVFFKGFGDSSLDFEIRVFLRDTSERVPAQNELRVAIFNEFKSAGIEMPYPQRDLHIRSGPGDFTSTVTDQ